MKTSIKNNIFHFEICDLKFEIMNFKLLDTIKDSLFSYIYNYDFIKTTKNRIIKKIDFNSEVFCQTIKLALLQSNKSSFSENKNKIILFFEEHVYDVLNNKKYKTNITIKDCYGTIREINYKKNKFLVFETNFNEEYEKKLLKYNKQTKCFEFVCDIEELKSNNNRYFIISTIGDLYFIDEDLYKQEKIKDYNKIDEVFFQDKLITVILKRNSINKKIIYFEGKEIKEIKSKSKGIFTFNNMIFFKQNEKLKTLLSNKEVTIKRMSKFVDGEMRFINVFENQKFILSQTRTEKAEYNLTIFNKELNEIEILNVKEILKIDNKNFVSLSQGTKIDNENFVFLEQGTLNIFNAKEGNKTIKINNTNFKNNYLNIFNDKIYILECNKKIVYLLIYDLKQNKIIKETNCNNLCFIKDEYFDNFEYLDNITEQQMQKNYLLENCAGDKK